VEILGIEPDRYGFTVQLPGFGALRTIPPREQAGNVDIKQLGVGATLLIPVDTPGALFSAGDAHFAQGDCETTSSSDRGRITAADWLAA
jgi:formamidase